MAFSQKLKILLLLTLSLMVVSSSFAQQGNYLDDEGSNLWEEEETFTDVTGREFETLDRQYVGEEQIKAAEEAAKKAGLPSIDIAAAIEKDKELMPDNMLYGIGTGALLGGWLALVQKNQNSRQKVQYLSVGILVGALIGMAVGTKSLYLQPAPQQANLLDNFNSDKTGDHLQRFNGNTSQNANHLAASIFSLNMGFKF